MNIAFLGALLSDIFFSGLRIKADLPHGAGSAAQIGHGGLGFVLDKHKNRLIVCSNALSSPKAWSLAGNNCPPGQTKMYQKMHDYT